MYSTRLKLSTVCSKESYDWLQAWIIETNPTQRYPMSVQEYFYRNRSHREYLSKFIESVIVNVLRSKGADPQKAPDKGLYVDNSKTVTDVVGLQRKIGSGKFVHQKGVRPGRADVTCFFNGEFYNLEVKVGNDRQSAAQKAEQKRCLSNGERYEIIKNVDEFLKLIEI